VRFADRFATFSAADGSPVSSVAGLFAAISIHGALAAAVRNDGSVEVVDLATLRGVAVQADPSGPNDSVSFGPAAGRRPPAGRRPRRAVHELRSRRRPA